MVLNKEGKTILMDEAFKDNILVSVVKNYAQRTFRTLLVAYVDYTATEWTALSARHNGFQKEEDQLNVEKDLVLVGIFGLVDPLRPGIRAAVEQCHRSGINVRMCTGDNIDTAIAISKDAGIINEVDLLHNEDGYLCMTGK
jgi:magnesium-transporting ATPase (P-type)